MAQRRPRILIVEDQLDVREAMAELMRSAGYSVVTAWNGADALSKLDRTALPDLIVLDLSMPVMNGYDFGRALRADPALSRIPVLLCSGESAPQLGVVAAETLLPKPVDLRVLMLAVETRCGLRPLS